MLTCMLDHTGAPSLLMLKFLDRYKKDFRDKAGLTHMQSVFKARKHCITETSATVLPLADFQDFEFCLLALYNCVLLEQGELLLGFMLSQVTQ